MYTHTPGTGISSHGEESWVVLSPDNTEIDNSVAQDMYDDEDSANSVTNRGRLLVDGERAVTHDTGVSIGSTDNEDEEDESSSSHPTTPPENMCDTERDDTGGLGVRDGTAARMLPRNGSLPERPCPTARRKIDAHTQTHTHTHTQIQRSTRRLTRILEYLALSKSLPPSMAAMVRREENCRRGELRVRSHQARGRLHQARGRLKSGCRGVFSKEKLWPLRGLPLSLSLFSSISPGS